MSQTATSGVETASQAFVLNTPRNERHQYSARCIPPIEHDLSLDQLHDNDNPDRARLLKTSLGQRLSLLGIRTAYGPAVADMSGIIVSSGDLTERIELACGVVLARNMNLPADGTLLTKNEAFVMDSDGSPVVIATGGGLCIVARVSRDSAVDRVRIMGGDTKLRTYPSTINAMAATAKAAGVPLEEMTLRVLFQIPPACFRHPLTKEGEPRWDARKYNVLMTDYVETRYGAVIQIRGNVSYLDLGKLIAVQARLAGFGRIYDDERPLPYDGPFAHTRHENPVLRERCNLVVVQRIS